MSEIFNRNLGKSNIKVSALGMGCWAIGGPFTSKEGMPLGWSAVDDNESVRALEVALDQGVTLFDTADIYGTGHSEKILGNVLKSQRDKVVIATKFGMVYDAENKLWIDSDGSPAYIRKALEQSLKRLQTDYIDLYQFHLPDYPKDQAQKTRDTLEDLVSEGKIRGYAWSTDITKNVELFSKGQNCIAVQQQFNIFEGNGEILDLCEEKNLASLIRGPLAMGVLTGKFNASSTFPNDDVRSIIHAFGLTYFKDGKPDAGSLKKLDAVREILTSNDRTLAQGSLAWLWARSEVTLPIPGFKTIQQVQDNCGALEKGPLTSDQMQEIAVLMAN